MHNQPLETSEPPSTKIEAQLATLARPNPATPYSHGYSHENPKDMTLQQQKDVLDKTFPMLTEFAGKPPRGSVAPWWETSKEECSII